MQVFPARAGEQGDGRQVEGIRNRPEATGPVVVLGFLATIIVAGIENAVVVGGVAALAAALCSIGVPKDSVLQYESAIKADSFLVMARGTKEEIARAKTILGATNPSRLDIHRDADAVAAAASSTPAAA